MNREQAIALARECAKARPQSYYAEPFEPHEWVIDAIMRATSELPSADDFDTAIYFLEQVVDSADDEWPTLEQFLASVRNKENRNHERQE
jgi:hypothetical protein